LELEGGGILQKKILLIHVFRVPIKILNNKKELIFKKLIIQFSKEYYYTPYLGSVWINLFLSLCK
jgi:hypothetical protein